MGILRPQRRRMCCASRSPPRWFVRWAKWASTACSPTAARDLIATADSARPGRSGRGPLGSRTGVARTHTSRSSACSRQRFRRRAKRLHRRGDSEERRPGLRGERHPAGKRQGGLSGSNRPGGRRLRSRPGQGEAEAFLALEKEYRANPAVVRERLYRDAVEKAIATPATCGGYHRRPTARYHGFRITIWSGNAAIRLAEPGGGRAMSDVSISGDDTQNAGMRGGRAWHS